MRTRVRGQVRGVGKGEARVLAAKARRQVRRELDRLAVQLHALPAPGGAVGKARHSGRQTRHERGRAGRLPAGFRALV